MCQMQTTTAADETLTAEYAEWLDTLDAVANQDDGGEPCETYYAVPVGNDVRDWPHDFAF
jgi:hypothetical protein